jgi:hypothetical protein
MIRNPFAIDLSPGRLHLTLRTLAANDNVPLDATSPPLRASASASTLWPLLRVVRFANLRAKLRFAKSSASWPSDGVRRLPIFAEPGVFPAPNSGLGVEAGRIKGVARP